MRCVFAANPKGSSALNARKETAEKAAERRKYMKPFEIPQVEIVRFDVLDVLASSGDPDEAPVLVGLCVPF